MEKSYFLFDGLPFEWADIESVSADVLLCGDNDGTATEKDLESTMNEDSLTRTGNDGETGNNASQCMTCQFTWENRDEQLQHYKSEWHNVNLRRKLDGRPPLNESEADDLSEDADDEKETSSDMMTNEMLDNLSLLSTTKWDPLRYPFIDIRSKKVFSVLKSLVPTVNEKASLALFSKNVMAEVPFAVVLLTGGRFAGAIFKGSKCVRHKTFVRYTIRAKQGGSQGIRDGQNAQKAPKSAGSSLRRYNEAALAKEVIELLESWKEDLRECSHIFSRFSTYHQSILHAVIPKHDPRIATIPFITTRPTLDECKRIHRTLSTVNNEGTMEDFREKLKEKLSQVKSEAAAAESAEQQFKRKSASSKRIPLPDEIYDIKELEGEENGDSNASNNDGGNTNSCRKKSPSKPIPMPKSSDPKHLQTRELFTILKRQNFSELDEFLSRTTTAEKEDRLDKIHLLNSPCYTDGGSSLHLAAAEGFTGLVTHLLRLGASPTVENLKEQVPFQVCKDRATRRTFSEYRAECPNPHEWDWNRAQIPLPLSDEAEAAKQAKLAEKRRKEKERKKVKAKENQVKRVEEATVERFKQLSDREKRALAIERRLGIVSRCFLCAKDMTGLVPFEYSNNSFCSMPCLKEHRKTIVGS